MNTSAHTILQTTVNTVFAVTPFEQVFMHVN